MSHQRITNKLPIIKKITDKDFIHTFKNHINIAVLLSEMLINEHKDKKEELAPLQEMISSINLQVVETVKNAKEEKSSKESIEESMNACGSELAKLIEVTNKLLDQFKQDSSVRSSLSQIKSSLIDSQNHLLGIGQEPTPIIKVFDDYREKCRSKNGNTIKFTIQDNLDREVLEGEKLYLVKDILENCILNADDFTLNGVINITIFKNGDNICLTIQDTGPGMPEEVKVSILQGSEVTTARPARGEHEPIKKGNGIGLAGITHELKKFKGSLSIATQQEGENHGTTFTYSFPAVVLLQKKYKLEQKTKPAPIKDIKNIPEKSVAKTIIYYVDDISINQKVFAQYLKKNIIGIEQMDKFEIRTFTEPSEMFFDFEKNPSQVGGIILDMHLNKVTGLQVKEKLLNDEKLGSYARELPIYYYSGDAIPEEFKHMEQQYLQKSDPKNKAKLLAFCKKALESSHKIEISSPLPFSSPQTAKHSLLDSPEPDSSRSIYKNKS